MADGAISWWEIDVPDIGKATAFQGTSSPTSRSLLWTPPCAVRSWRSSSA